MKKYLIKLVKMSFFFAFANTVFFSTTGAANNFLNLSSKDIESISDRIWQNESGKSIPYLTYWSPKEKFPSLGFGHFIWYTADKQEDFDESFPKLIRYMQEQHTTLPRWLDKPEIPACPWQSREEFLRAIENKEPRMEELRQFLLKTKSTQARYFIYRLETTLPIILNLIPDKERLNIQNNINQLMRTPTGIYSLVDYTNFKGDGIKEYQRCSLKQSTIEIHEISKSLSAEQVYACGWGLLQVLRKMLQAPTDLTPNDAFSWAAGKALEIRVAAKPSEEHWLPGWLKRINTYKDKQSDRTL
jgi:hypothetical protein